MEENELSKGFSKKGAPMKANFWSKNTVTIEVARENSANSLSQEKRPEAKFCIYKETSLCITDL